MKIRDIKKYNLRNLTGFVTSFIVFGISEYIYKTSLEFGYSAKNTLSFVVAFVSACFALGYLCLYLHFSLTTSIRLKKFDLKDIEKELAEEGSNFYRKQRIYITKNYLLTTHISGVKCFRLKDIAWIYTGEKYRYFSLNEKRKCLVVRTTNRKKYKSSGIIEQHADELNDVIVSIIDKAPEILSGYTYENNCRYKAISVR